MIVTYKVYKHSVLATIMSLAGSCLGLYGLIGTIVTIIDGTFNFGTAIVGLVGVAIAVLAGVIGKRKTVKKRKKAMEDPQLIEKVRASAEAAYKYYEANEFIEVFHVIERYNPYAAARIYELKNGTKSRHQILQELRAYDKRRDDPVNYRKEPTQGLEGEYAAANKAREEKLSKSMRTNKKVFVIAVIVLPVMIAGVIVASFFRAQREPVEYKNAETGDYTCVYVTSLEESSHRNGHIYYFFETEEGETGTLRLTEEDGQKDEVRGLSEEAEDKTVVLYGVIKREKSVATIGGSTFTLPNSVLYATVEPQNEPLGVEGMLTLMACAAAVTVFIAGVNYSSAKKELKQYGRRQRG